MKKTVGFMMGVAAVGLMGTLGYMMIDKSKKNKIDKILNNAADEAHNLMNKMGN